MSTFSGVFFTAFYKIHLFQVKALSASLKLKLILRVLLKILNLPGSSKQLEYTHTCIHFKNGTEKDVPVPTEDDTSELFEPDKVSGWPALRTETLR